MIITRNQICLDMERIVHIAKNHEEAMEWDIKQARAMSLEQRLNVAKKLKTKAYGPTPTDVKSAERRKSHS